MNNIKKTFISDENILIIDKNNKLWIMGANTNHRTGFSNSNQTIYSPINTGIILDIDETVVNFYARRSIVGIYTSAQKLFVSRSIDKKNVIQSTQNTPFDTNFLYQSAISQGLENELLDEDNDEINGLASINNTNEGDDYDYGDYDDSDFIDMPSLDMPPLPNNTIAQTFINEMRILINQLNPNIDVINDDIDNNLSTDIITIDNLEYYSSVMRGVLLDEVEDVYFHLLADNVTNVLFVSETIFFLIGGNIHFFNKKINETEIIVKKKFGFSVMSFMNNNNIYYQIVLPFQYDKLIFCKDFIYMTSGQFMHIISAFWLKELSKTETEPDIITWIYFKSDELVNETSIYFLFSEGTIYVNKDDGLYKYSHEYQDIKKMINNDSKIFFLRTNDDIESNVFCQRNDGIYVDYGAFKMKIPPHLLLDYLVDFNLSNKSQLIIINKENAPKYTIADTQLFFNINGMDYFKLMDDGLIYYDSKTLYFCTNKILEENVYGTIEIEQIDLNNESYYIYIFTSVPDSIIDIQFNNQIIILQTKDKFYYHTIGSNMFIIDKFTPIIIETLSDSDLVLKHHIVRTKKKYQSMTTLYISSDANKLDKLMNIADMLPKTSNFEINFKDGIRTISYGDGPKRQFLEAAIEEFAEKYLITHNNSTNFNLEKMEKFTDNELITIGTMLHLVICHSQSNLPIRLPLMLLTSIIKKSPTNSDLEYFAKLEDMNSFNNLYKYRDDDNAIKDFGYDNYEDCLKAISKYSNSNTSINKEKHVAKLIAKGFRNYDQVKNLSIMNLPTLDYYLSGDYVIDRVLLIKNLKVYFYEGIKETKSNTEFYLIIKNIINNLPEEKLIILLRNWTGTCIIKKSSEYQIYVDHTSSGIYFGTCNMQLTISENFIKDPVLHNTLIEILTTPYDVMIDR